MRPLRAMSGRECEFCLFVCFLLVLALSLSIFNNFLSERRDLFVPCPNLDVIISSKAAWGRVRWGEGKRVLTRRTR